MTEAARLPAVAFADRLARRCTHALGDMTLAAIWHGSLTLGDFTPGRSDIDLLFIVRGALTEGEARHSGTRWLPHATRLRIASIFAS